MEDLKKTLCNKMEQVISSEKSCAFEVINDTVFKMTSLFNEVDSMYKQNKKFVEIFNMTKPTEIVLGTRIDQRNDITSAQSLSTVVAETFQYIPLKQVLQQLFHQSNFDHLLKKSSASSSSNNHAKNNDVISSFSDGVIASNHELFSQNNSIQIQLYYDDVEVVNPLGSKTKIHEFGMFYYSILNLPRKFAFTLPNIFVLAVTYSSDLKKIWI